MANMNLVTGFAGQAHVTAADAGALNVGLVGSGQYVLPNGNMFAVNIVTNNQVTVLDGDILMQGRHIRIDPGTSVDLTIENGAAGYYRNDLIAVRYTKDAITGVEEANLVVIKGTATTSTASDPEYTVGDIVSGEATANDMPLYRIQLDGLNVMEPVALFETTGDLGEHISDENNPHKVTASQVGALPAKITGITEPMLIITDSSGNVIASKTFAGDLVINGTLTATKVVGAVYA